METWKPVLGFENLYEVSDLGNVRRTARAKSIDAAKIQKAKKMLQEGTTLKNVAAFLQTSITTAHSIKMEKTWAGEPTYRPVKIQLLKGYCVVSLCKDGKYTRRSVHRMMWESFYGEIEGRLEINHKDLNRSNNILSNLELVTHQQNLKHAIDAYKSRGLLRATKGVKGFISGKHSVYNNL